ncbi:MAG: putative glutamine amidotransferase [Candidatus Azotimanducaceae bacterium]|jgi:putative glutamine amidotransferase
MALRAERGSSRPVVGVTGSNQRVSPSWLCIRLSVWLAGGVAKRISVDHHVELALIDALVISGGDDIHPSLSGAEPRPSQFYDVSRDTLETEHIRYALEISIPMLGICRGHQLINVVLGGNLLGDIREMRKKTYNRRGLLATKTIALNTDSRLRNIMGRDRIKANSLHFQAVDKVAEQATCTARDLDKFCQAIELPAADVIGVQWHPEYLFYLPSHLNLFRWLIKTAADKGMQT